MNGKKLDDNVFFRIFMDQFSTSMGNMGDIWGSGLTMELPRTDSKSAWLDVSRSFKATGDNLRKAITTINANE